VWAFTELGTPLMLGYDRHIAVQVWNGLAEAARNRLPYAQVIVMLAVAGACYALAQFLFARQEKALAAKGGYRQPSAVPRQPLAWTVIGGTVLLAASPHAAVAAGLRPRLARQSCPAATPCSTPTTPSYPMSCLDPQQPALQRLRHRPGGRAGVFIA
jgi:hypothetical protein